MAQDGRALHRLTTPRAAALAGVVFAVLFTTTVVVIGLALPRDPLAGAQWVAPGASRLRLALTLTPFSGIAFLWFLGVLRDRFEDLEDRFFASVFLGSGLLFLAMYFVSMAVAGALVASTSSGGGAVFTDEVVDFGRTVMVQVSNVYALRMAAVFMISLGTIWLKTGLMPTWLAALTFIVAAALLVVMSLSLWIILVFPAWVALVSVVHLLRPVPRPADRT